MAQKGVKIMAIIALICIIISIVSTGIIYILGNNLNNNKVDISKDLDIVENSTGTNLSGTTYSGKHLEISNVKISEPTSEDSLSGTIIVE